jgi:hypothetical protein
LGFGINIFVRVFIGVHAPTHVVVGMLEDLVQKNAEV